MVLLLVLSTVLLQSLLLDIANAQLDNVLQPICLCVSCCLLTAPFFLTCYILNKLTHSNLKPQLSKVTLQKTRWHCILVTVTLPHSFHGMVPSAYRKFQMLIIMVIYHKELFLKARKSSVFYSLRRLHIWVSCSALNSSTAPSIPPTFLTICNRKTITQSVEIPIFVGETRRSHICSHHGSGLGLVPGQADSISRAEMMVRWSLCGRPPREAERWHHWENENSSVENSYLRNDLPEFESSKRILFPTPFQRQRVFSVNPIIL